MLVVESQVILTKRRRRATLPKQRRWLSLIHPRDSSPQLTPFISTKPIGKSRNFLACYRHVKLLAACCCGGFPGFRPTILSGSGAGSREPILIMPLFLWSRQQAAQARLALHTTRLSHHATIQKAGRISCFCGTVLHVHPRSKVWYPPRRRMERHQRERER